jgi:hypothetical protein
VTSSNLLITREQEIIKEDIINRKRLKSKKRRDLGNTDKVRHK